MHLLEEAEQLSAPERAELADRIVESLAYEISPELQQAQINEVRRRIYELEAGTVGLVAGSEALAQVRQLLNVAREAS